VKSAYNRYARIKSKFPATAAKGEGNSTTKGAGDI
jgi:hypothetical protein